MVRSGQVDAAAATLSNRGTGHWDIKRAQGFRSWTVGGLENVRTQWAFACSAYNLKKLCKAWKQRLASANGPLVGLAFTQDFFGAYPLLMLAPSVAGRLAGC